MRKSLVFVKTLARLLIIAVVPAVFCAACTSGRTILTRQDIPATVLWAWERPEDLMWLGEDHEIGVAFLAQTLELKNDGVVVTPRRQPLAVPEGTYLIAVTRIESSRSAAGRAKLTDKQKEMILKQVSESSGLKGVRAIQIDFDALRSERRFYGEILALVRKSLPVEMPLSMTALASWCVGDRWIADLPVDEVVPMVFDMGTGSAEIKRFLSGDNDWVEPRCRESYGVAIYEPVGEMLRDNRRMYFFNKRPWKESDMRFVNTR